MKVTLNWIMEFLDTDYLDPYEIAHLLTMSGTEVKKIDDIGKRFKNMIVGEIISFKQHPNADKLAVCKVDNGREVLNIVCGAKNFKVKDKVVVALEGAITVQGLKIKKSRLRGVVSEGMMCSEQELGLSSNSEGIMILDKSYKTGKDFASSYGLDDFVFELEITPNRPDCLSIVGIAREISVLKKISIKDFSYNMDQELNKDSNFKINIKDYDLCSRYSGKIFRDIPPMDSPDWLKNRLIMCDYRPVDLTVDLTNYVMHEIGQPLHAFDKDLLYSDKIIIRPGKKNEKITTIDGSIINLNDNMLIIADEKRPVAIAGIMGGKDTEININTRNVFLESANFNGPSVMRTSKNLGLRTEASNRFEKKLDPQLTTDAIKRFEELLTSIAGKISTSVIYDKYRARNRNRKISLRIDRVKDVLGAVVEKNDMKNILNRLDIKTNVNDSNDRILDCLVPSFRFEDIVKEIDLIEEVARIYGFDKFKPVAPECLMNIGRYTFSQKIIKEIRSLLGDLGINEVINYSFLSKEWFKRLRLDREEKYKDSVGILNPINEDFAILRTTPMPLMLKNVINNVNRGSKDIPIFEITKVFKKSRNKNKFYEFNVLGIMVSGRAVPKSWNNEQRNYDFFDLKGILEYLVEHFNKSARLSIGQKEYSFFHPVISGDIKISGLPIGIIGKVHPEIIDFAGIGQDVFYMELNLKDFIDNITQIKQFHSISAFPSIEIDLAFVVDEDIQNIEIENEIKKSGTDILKSVRLFDIYKGEQIEENKKSVAYSLTFRDESRTLKDTEVDIIVNRIIENLSKKLNARLRE